MRGLSGKTAIVTGGLGDLGYASAVRLAEEGCKVALFDIKEDTQGHTEEVSLVAYQVDISDERQLENAIAGVE
ncbi:SDR family NAD(P)-dependent oxidoreductase, partial [bacterium]|nr:SDR family NAD(P)-dependent oxidoreductase [bacterium]